MSYTLIASILACGIFFILVAIMEILNHKKNQKKIDRLIAEAYNRAQKQRVIK